MSKKVEPDFSQSPGPALHSASWRFGPFELDETRRELRRDGELLAIEPKPLNMLMLLLRHPGELVTKGELLDALWTGRIVNEAVVGNCISSVREVLGDVGASWLKTVHGFGYRFDAPVQLVEDSKGPEIAAAKLGFQIGDQPPLRPNWRLLRRLGQTGDTWLAEHQKLRERRVFKFTTDASGLSALKREVTIHRLLRQSLGDKDHYVEVLDWNFDEPPYFIETEYCQGGSLLDWFESQGGAARVALETRIELVARIADALADVHLVGVLHKDLKPANVFVVPGDGDIPKIRLADFGASRILDPGLLARLEITRHGFTQVIDPNADLNAGTLLYLAPEVASGQPATGKADIYALGVMLYQFVVGSLRRQLGAGWEIGIDDEMLRADIAAAAENNPERRLANAAELATRLRSLAARRRAYRDAIEAARKAEAAARAMDRMKARRVGVVVAFVALAVGLTTSTVLYLDARKARLSAEAAAARANTVSRFLADEMFSSVDAEKRPVRSITVKELLDAGAGKLATNFKDSPEVEADIRLSLGRAYSTLMFPAEAGEQIEEAIAKYGESVGPRSAQSLRAAAMLITNHYERRLLPATIDKFRSISKTSDLEGNLRAKDRIHFEIELARGESLIGENQMAAKRLAELIKLLDGTTDELLHEIYLLHAWTLINLSDFPAAKRANARALEQLQSHFGEKHIKTSRAILQKIHLLIESGELDLAQDAVADATRAAKAWVEDNSAVLIGLSEAEGIIAERRGDVEKCVEVYEAALKNYKVTEDVIDESSLTRRRLAQTYLKLGRTSDFVAMINSAIDIATANHGPYHNDAIEARLVLLEYAIQANDLKTIGLLSDQLGIYSGGVYIENKLTKVQWLLAKSSLARSRSESEIAAATLKSAIDGLIEIFGENQAVNHPFYITAMRIAASMSAETQARESTLTRR